MKFIKSIVVFSLLALSMSCSDGGESSKDDSKKQVDDSKKRGDDPNQPALHGIWVEPDASDEDMTCYQTLVFNERQKKFAVAAGCEFEKDSLTFKKGESFNHIFLIGTIVNKTARSLEVKVDMACDLDFLDQTREFKYGVSKSDGTPVLDIKGDGLQVSLIKSNMAIGDPKSLPKDTDRFGCAQNSTEGENTQEFIEKDDLRAAFLDIIEDK